MNIEIDPNSIEFKAAESQVVRPVVKKPIENQATPTIILSETKEFPKPEEITFDVVDVNSETDPYPIIKVVGELNDPEFWDRVWNLSNRNIIKPLE